MGVEKKAFEAVPSVLQRGCLIEKIYSTISDPLVWRTFLSELVASTHSRSARLLVMDSKATRVLSSVKHNIDDHYHRQYIEHYVNACPWRPELLQKAPGRLYSTYLHFSCRQSDFFRSEFYNDWARPQDIHHGICGTIYQDCDQTVQLLVQRTRQQGCYTESDTVFFNDFVPHFQQAFQLARQFAHSQARAQAIEIAAGAERLPFLLLDFSLRPVYCNPGAEALINSESSLLLKNEKLYLADRELDQTLQRLLKTCLKTADSRTLHATGGTLEVPQPHGSSLHLQIKPVHPDISLLGGQQAGYVAVYVYDPGAKILIDRERLSQLYALSKAEIRVAMEMLSTPDPAEVAKRCFISLHTVRSHLKAIFAKTNSKNQADLVKLLLSGPIRQR